MARELYQSLLTQVASEHLYFWLNSLKEFSHAEQCLTGLQEESFSSALGCIAESLKFYHKGIASLTVSPPSRGECCGGYPALGYSLLTTVRPGGNIRIIHVHRNKTLASILKLIKACVLFFMKYWVPHIQTIAESRQKSKWSRHSRLLPDPRLVRCQPGPVPPPSTGPFSSPVWLLTK